MVDNLRRAIETLAQVNPDEIVRRLEALAAEERQLRSLMRLTRESIRKRSRQSGSGRKREGGGCGE